MKTLIVYNSIHHGNTEKIANAMARELNADLVKSSSVSEVDFSKYDLIGLGSGIYFGKHHVSILNLVEKMGDVKDKRFFIFSTSGSSENIFNKLNNELKKRITSKGGRIMGIFNCLGLDTIGPLKYVGGINKGRPDEDDLSKARAFAQSLMPKVLTLCLTVEDGKALLGMKKRGFGKGRWNGFGGKVEAGETIIEGAKREMLEESGLEIEELVERGIIEFDFLDTGKLLQVHIFEVLRYSGSPVETEEMRPEWFSLDKIPFDNMWADDPFWFPLFLDKKRFEGMIIFKDNDEIVRSTIKVLD